jgi:hypothetical protein
MAGQALGPVNEPRPLPSQSQESAFMRGLSPVEPKAEE